MRDPTGAHAALRAGTRAEHERLDALMTRFDLGDRGAYARFLAAHARALPPIEAALDKAGFAARLDDWPRRRRAGALAADLAALGAGTPAALPAPALAEAAAQWGAAYVIEGSRLGGAMLARQVDAALPQAYLGTPQPAGAWRGFLAALDAAVVSPGDRATATDAARSVFALFERAARVEMDPA